jgi:hypothetical protein
MHLRLQQWACVWHCGAWLVHGLVACVMLCRVHVRCEPSAFLLRRLTLCASFVQKQELRRSRLKRPMTSSPPLPLPLMQLVAHRAMADVRLTSWTRACDRTVAKPRPTLPPYTQSGCTMTYSSSRPLRMREIRRLLCRSRRRSCGHCCMCLRAATSPSRCARSS